MSATESAPPARKPRLTFAEFVRSGGWSLLVGLGLAAIVAVWRISVIVAQLDQRAIGDGRTLDSYGYNLAGLRVPREYLYGAGYVRDGIPALENPPKLTASEADEFHRWLRKEHRHKFVIDSDLVLALELNGVAVAYPTRLLAWHQVINDALGDEPILVTYDPLCDSGVIFSRRVDEAVLDFGASGVLYNSNLVVYDRQPSRDAESLWCQLQFGAIAGPRAGQALRVLPAVVVPWGVWRAAHADTTIFKLDVERLQVYRQSFGGYYGSDDLHFPVAPRPDRTERPWKTPTLAVQTADGWRYAFLNDLLQRADAQGVVTIRAGSRDVPLAVDPSGDSAWPARAADRADLTTVRALWFALYAQQPELKPLFE